MSLVIASAATSKVTIEGEDVAGLQSIEFVVRRRQMDVDAVGVGERIGVDAGHIFVTGTLRIRSLNSTLDERLYALVPEPFNMVAELKQGETTVKTITFDECFLDDKSFELTANGVGITVYNFTATRVREE
jgi:hypothetical protein